MPKKERAAGCTTTQTAHKKTSTSKFTANTASAEALVLTMSKTEARVDSRLLAQHLGNQHRPMLALIDKYLDRFERLGKVLFQKAPSAESKTGQRPRFVLLTEDQAIYLLALCDNTERTADLKLKLVLAFREARKAAALHDSEYLPTLKTLHDRMDVLAAESPNRHHVHANVNRLLNKFAGIDAGQRANASLGQQSMLVVGQLVATKAIEGAPDHHDAYQRAKAALGALTAATALEVSA